ncbi:MAG: hypothetical protein LC623_04805, partial [Halobacteriales archaeon]|nr:hypothetical protein [Halobacteriales archaeon]
MPTASAQPPGNYSVTFESLTASYFDFKDGVGIADPTDQNNPCTALLLGLRGTQPPAETWDVDQNMGTNLNGPAFGIAPLIGPMSPAGGWLPDSGGLNLGFPCPPQLGSGGGNLWLVFSGMNWRSAQADSATNLYLCSQMTFTSSSPGCLAVPDANMHLWVSACTSAESASFSHDYTDGKGKYLAGLPFDTLGLKNDMINCPVRRSIDYTNTIQDFTAGGASQTFDIIKNDAVVTAGSGTTYMAICWRITYLNFSDPLAPTSEMAQTHDWKLILDLNDAGGPAGWLSTLQLHYGGQQPGDSGIGATTALRGFYSDDAGYSNSVSDGQNGPGPCTNGPSYLTKLKEPSPL